MKKLVLSSIVIVAALVLQSFQSKSLDLQAGNKEITKSQVVWKAYKVTGSHSGSVGLKSGALTFDGNKLSGGSFIIDMTTLACTDLEGDYKNKLEGHLKSDDFFGVEKHGTSALNITKVKSTGKNSYQVKGDLKIKGISKSIDFQVSIYGNKASANLKVDRTDFGIKYGSGSYFEDLQDKMIYDEFDLNIDLEF
ncbi:MAG: polyisoprenoid-binding protein YceI [Bacteroidia bacterium]|jgi:polyisoprenoid-binding protein YceI